MKYFRNLIAKIKRQREHKSKKDAIISGKSQMKVSENLFSEVASYINEHYIEAKPHYSFPSSATTPNKVGTNQAIEKQQVSRMLFCRNCGSNNTGNYCGTCGKKMRDELGLVGSSQRPMSDFAHVKQAYMLEEYRATTAAPSKSKDNSDLILDVPFSKALLDLIDAKGMTEEPWFYEAFFFQSFTNGDFSDIITRLEKRPKCKYTINNLRI